MDIVLATINAKWIHPSLALRLLKANLGNLKERCVILEFALRQPLKEKVEPIIAARPRLLGISVSIWNHLATLELLKFLNEEWKKEIETKPLVVLGGPEVSWLPEEAELFRYADYVIRGEGELAFRDFCRKVINSDRNDFNSPAINSNTPRIKNNNNSLVFLGKGEDIVDVKEISSAYDLYTDEDIRKKLTYVEASRGCPYSCEFCQAGSQANVREFPLAPFLADMDKLLERGVKTFKFLDRTFNLNMDRVQKIMEFFLEKTKARGRSPFCVHFEMIPSHFPLALRELIKRFPPGSLRLELGIQTFNSETAALICRSGNSREALETLEFLRRQTSAIVHADLIAGLPGESPGSFGAGFDMLWAVLSRGTPIPFEIQLGILKCLPGTPIARHNDLYGMIYSATPPYEVLETAAISMEQLEKIKNYGRFWEIIVNRNPFPGLIKDFLMPGQPVFERFMNLADYLYNHFKRNWGIDRKDLKKTLEDFL